MSYTIVTNTDYPACIECHKSHRGYYPIAAWDKGYCPECGPNGSDLLKSDRELKAFHGIPTVFPVSNKQE